MCDVKKEINEEINDIKEIFEAYKRIQKVNGDNIYALNKSIKTFRYLLILLFFIIMLLFGILVYSNYKHKSKTIIGSDNVVVEKNYLNNNSDIRINDKYTEDEKNISQ